MHDRPRARWRHRLHEIVFEADTRAGKAFDMALLVAILVSVGVVMLESVTAVRERYGTLLNVVEWLFTIAFTLEYVARLLSVGRPSRYARSFFGIVDLLSIVPTYLSVVLTGAQSLLVIRVFRLLRIFRVFKLRHYLTEAAALQQALQASRTKVTVFLVTVISIAVVAGTLMYLIEVRLRDSPAFHVGSTGPS